MSLNIRLLPALLETEINRLKLADMVLGYFKKRGMHVQFNVVDQEVLKDAQIYAEKYQDLIIRVSGYNAYFTRIPNSLQDDIID